MIQHLRLLGPGWLALLCAAVFIANISWRPAEFALVAEVQAEAPVRLQLRYTRDYGFRRDESATESLTGGTGYVRVRFPIYSRSVRNLRLIELDGATPVALRGLQLERLGGQSRSITRPDVAPVASTTNIVETTPSGDLLLSSTDASGAAVTILAGTRLKVSRLARLTPRLLVVALAAASIAFVLSLVRFSGSPIRSSTGEDTAALRVRSGVLALIVAGYLGASLANLNGSSTALWRQYADGLSAQAAVILGTPRDVRADEWMLQTPWIFSQSAQASPFSTSNPAIGGGSSPLVLNLPVRHWSTLLRPQMWPFFVMNVERAFAFYWNFKVFGLVLGAVLFFGTITNRNTFLDCAGAVFLTFSPYIQWWFSTATCMPEMLAMFFFGLWLAIVIARAEQRWVAVLAAAALVVVLANFVFCCYPRFQVPLAYCAVAVCLATVRLRPSSGLTRMFRIGCFTFTLLASALLICMWYRDAGPVIEATSLLSYPGQVRSTGGDFAWSRLLAPFLEFSMGEQHFPSGFANVCEAAGFLFLAPLLFVVVARDFRRGRRDWLLVTQVALLVATVYFMVIGIPRWFAHVSGWEYVYSTRAILLLGVSTVIVLVRYLSYPAEPTRATALPIALFAVTTFGLVALLIATNSRLGHFETTPAVVATALFCGLLAVCVWQRHATSLCILLVVPQFYSCALINPMGHGLPGLTQSESLRWLAAAHAKYPVGKWIVLGDSGRSQVLPDFIKATGAHALDGIHCNPDYDMLRVLDPAGKYSDVYNRYALIRFRSADVAEPILRATDGLAYDVEMPMRADLLDRLGVRYILQVDASPGTFSVPGFHSAGEHRGLELFERD